MVQPPRRGLSLLERRLADAHDIDDLRRLARRRVPRPIFDFVDGGAGDESTLRRNEDAFRAVELVPRVLRDVSAIDTSTLLGGVRAALPVILGPVGMTRMAHRHGEIGAARAAARAGIPYVLSTMASTSPERVAEHAPDSERWFQVYLWRDRAASLRLIERARAAGFTTLVLTVDVPVAGSRLRDARNGMTLPPSLTLKSVLQVARHPRWWVDALTLEPLGFAAIETRRAGFVEQSNRILDPSATLDDLDWLRSAWPGRILVKGVLSAEDARAVQARGADGVWLSNHGGRQLENAVAPLAMLPEVRAAVGAEAQVYVDGGVRSGAHIAAAVAAGADAVVIGRPYVYGLMAGGEAGVDRALDLLRQGLVRTMALLGAARLADLMPDMVRLPPRSPAAG
ncbi:MAG: lldD [Naasia sp.]|nr:lldD [Naasia sp.]